MAILAMVVALAAAIAAAAFHSKIISTSGFLHAPVPLNFPPPPAAHVFPPAKTGLQSLERIGHGELPGAEDLAVDRDEQFLYVSCKDGWIRSISIDDGSVRNWSYVGGRPLGIVAGVSDGEMLVCEPEQGLLSVTKNGVEVLSSQADGLKYKFADGVDVAKDGTVYFTDASTTYGLQEFDLDFLEGRAYGRLLKYSPQTKETIVLLKDLYFANGVALSENEDFLIICETSRVRLQRYWLHGERAGTAEVFVDNLPGLPDNVHRSGNKFWIALLQDRSFIWEKALRFPLFQHLAASQTWMNHRLHNSYASALAVDENGKPLELYKSLQSNSIRMMTTAMQVKNFLYVGSFSSDYVGRIPLD